MVSKISFAPKAPIIPLAKRSSVDFKSRYTFLGAVDESTNATIEYQPASRKKMIGTRIRTIDIDRSGGSKAAKILP